MRKYLISLTIFMAAATTVNAIQQSHRHTPRTAIPETETVAAQEDASDGQSDAKAKDATDDKSDTQKKKAAKHLKSVTISANAASDAAGQQDEGIEAYSDTSAAPLDSSSGMLHYSYQMDLDDDDLDMMHDGLSRIFRSMFGTMLIVLIIFVIAPVAILFIILYFAYKNRKQKLQLAEMAIKNGQPAPDILGRAKPYGDDMLWSKGIKNIFLGIGLMFFFGFMGFDTGIGIGFLVMFYGAGQAVIARTTQKRHNDPNNGRDPSAPSHDH